MTTMSATKQIIVPETSITYQTLTRIYVEERSQDAVKRLHPQQKM